MDIPVTREEMTEIILETLRKNNLKDAYIRPIVSRGVGDLGLDPRKCEKPCVVVIAQGWGAMIRYLPEKNVCAFSISSLSDSQGDLYTQRVSWIEQLKD